MSYRTIARRLALGYAALVLVLSTSAYAGGPPWISVELPGDPTNQASRGAVLLVRAYSCGAPTPTPVTATADGIVDGVTLTLLKTTAEDETVSLTVGYDSAAATKKIEGFVSAYNALASQIAKLRSYSPETNVAGPMIGD